MNARILELVVPTLFVLSGCSEARDPGPSSTPTSDAGAGVLDAGPTGAPKMGCLDISGTSTVAIEVQRSFETRVDLTFNGMPPPLSNGHYPPFLEATHETWGGSAITAYGLGDPDFVDGTMEVIPGPHRFDLMGGGCIFDGGTPYCAGRIGSLNIGLAPVALDLATGPIDFMLMLNGAPLPDREGGSMNRGWLQLSPFDPDVSWTSLLRLPTSGPVRVQVAAFVGTYDVVYSSGLCDVGGPCGDGVVGRITVEENAPAQTFDLRPVEVSGRLTHDGMVSDHWSGHLVFRLPAETRGEFGGARVEIAADGTYAVRLLPGVYDVAFERIAATSSDLPSGNIELRPGEVVSANTLLDLDLTSVALDLGVTLNGGRIPFSGEGYVVLWDADRRPHLSLRLREIASRWQGRVAAGRYSLSFETSVCNGDGLPCVGHELLPSIDLTSDQRINVDIEAYDISVTLTANGVPFGEDGGTRGLLSFASEDGRGVVELEVPLTGDARATVRLSPGRYHVSYRGTDDFYSQCVAAAPVPCGPVSLGAIEVVGDLETTLDVASVSVSGQVTIDGTPATFLYDEMAMLILDGLRVPIRADGSFEALLALGSYAVDYRPSCFGGDEVPQPRACVEHAVYRCDAP